VSGVESAAPGLASGHGAVTVFAGAAAVHGQGRGGELHAIRRTTSQAQRCMERRILAALVPKLNHTIVHSRDPRDAAEFFVSVFGLPPPTPFGPFLGVKLDNEVTLDFLAADGMEVQMQHYAFLVDEEEFDAIFGRLRARGIEHWADPGMRHAGRINHHVGGRGVYFLDPSGHLLEIITRPYGKWDEVTG